MRRAGPHYSVKNRRLAATELHEKRNYGRNAHCGDGSYALDRADGMESQEGLAESEWRKVGAKLKGVFFQHPAEQFGEPG